MSDNCAGGTLAPYVPSVGKPWNSLRVAHLYKRMAFGANYAQIQAGLLMTPGQLVDKIISDSKAAPLPTPPTWYNWTASNYSDFNNQSVSQYVEWYLQWIKEMLTVGAREKFALFWHNHFVTRYLDYLCPSYMYEYHKLLQLHAFGDFKVFLKEMGKSSAMLTFLDARHNVKGHPNENYARELMELFTMGVNNGYTQQDITEAARAFTGWVTISENCAAISFDITKFDADPKTIFGQTGNFTFDDVHDLIFQERALQVSKFICSKIYTQFAHPIPNDTIIDGMAQTFRNNNFLIEPVLLELFKSDHFFEDDAISVIIKSPIDLFVSALTESALPYDNLLITNTAYVTSDMGQQLFSPIDVSGWNGNRAWINSTSITKRWDILGNYFGYVLTQLDRESLRQLAIDISGNSKDVAVVAQKITDFFIPKGLEKAADYTQATIALKASVPQNYFDNGWWDLQFQYVPEQVYNLMLWIVRRPEFQLM